ncbi:N-acetylmuramoyl-L-alanine amidase [Gemmatimonas phototrophica]|uniref:N-acetylmuramoyl-L-alanine amidase n=1 Tax=Gemmatimonas phototrophica TaxID=1379270 RepID=UPI0013146C6C|nr:N-acetylmuramoyl-L-alanine amidase [Gemmatimonas phototrophica]
MRRPPVFSPVVTLTAVIWPLLALVTLGACRSGAPPTGASGPIRSGGAPALAVGLPPVPELRGAPLSVTVRYPGANQLLTARDSNFVLGSVGSGDATLQINGVAVPVAANGAFLAWLAVPAPASPRYVLQVVRGADTVRKTVPVRFPVRRALSGVGRLQVDSGSLAPGRGVWALGGDPLRVSLRAPRNATAWVMGADNQRWPLVSAAGPLPAGADSTGDVATVFATDLTAALLADSLRPARLLVARGRDTVSLPIPAVRALPAPQRQLGVLQSANRVGSDSDRVVSARTIVGGTYKWQLLPGTVLEVTGRQNGFTRVRLDNQLDVWVDSDELTLLPEGTPLPRRVTGGFRFMPNAEYVDMVIGTGDRPGHHVEAEGNTITLTLYGVQANPEISPILGNDTLVRRMVWEQVSSDRVKVTLVLSQPAYGWLSLWDDARRAFVLRVRRLPTIDAAHPLRGLTIAVDPGHPPAGATGPTGLYEGDAVFPVGLKVVELLRLRGANPVITRTSLAPVGLTERGVQSRRENAHAFVSVHLNALPDGVNPFTANGTSTLFYHNASEPLARDVQTALQARFGLRDLGVHYQNLAVARPSWYPSVLAEGLFLMIPEQEAAMRNEAFQLTYAEGLVEGLERYFRRLATPAAERTP